MTGLELIEEALGYRDALKSDIELARCALVIPRRSVDRVRRALADGRLDDALCYVSDIESGVEAAYSQLCDAEDR